MKACHRQSLYSNAVRYLLLWVFLVLAGCSAGSNSDGGDDSGNGDPSGDTTQGDNTQGDTSDGTNSRQGSAGGTTSSGSGSDVESNFNHPDAKGQKEGSYNATGNNKWKVQNSSTVNSLARVWGTAGNNIYAIGTNGTAMHFDGNNWTVIALGTQALLTDVWGGSAAEVYITGYDKSFEFNGSSWQEMATPNDAGLSSVWVAASGEVFVLDLQNRIYRRNNDGSWALSYNGGSSVSDLYQIRGSAVDNIYVAGFPTLHFDGDAWSKVDLGTVSNSSHAVWVNSATDAYLLFEDQVFFYDGNGWSSTDSGANVQLKSIWASSLGNIYISGYGVYHFNGAGWNSEIDPDSGLVYGLWGASATDIYGVGEAGRIIRHIP